MSSASYRPYLITILTLLCAWSVCSFTTSLTLSNSIGIRTELPDEIAGYTAMDLLFCQNESCQRCWRKDDLKGSVLCPACSGSLDPVSLAEHLQLPDDTRITRRQYETQNGRWMLVTILISGQSRSSIHRPQWCLQAQGHAILKTETIQIPVTDTRQNIGVRLLETTPSRTSDKNSSSVPRHLYAYWFISAEDETPYHFVRILCMARDRLLRGEIRRWGYISVMSGSKAPITEQRKEIAGFIKELHSRITSHSPK